MNKYLAAFLLVFLSSLCLPALAQSAAPTTQLQERLQAHLDSLWQANGFPGATFSVVLPDGRQLSLATGTADSASRQPMRPDSRMFSGSNGKTLFVAAAMALQAQGAFHLDDSIKTYIGQEQWFNRIPNARAITMRMLLNHTSGIMEYYELGDFMQQLKENPARTWTPVELLAYVFDREPLFAAGQGFSYADTNFILFGYILEKITGRNMYELARQYVLSPYRLTATVPSVHRAYPLLAVGYARAGGPFPVEGAFVKDGRTVFSPQFEWTGGGFVSSVADLASWAKTYYLLPGVPAEAREQMRQGVPANTGKDHRYGLGMQLRPGGTAGMGYGHSGWFPGYLTDAEYFPDLDLALAIQFNTDDFRLLKRTPHAYLLDMARIVTQTLSQP
ncbi:serine hydrolase domain-containing protein [Pontibacter mangrovi]|uniref:Beta-lactamase family protein n=1 Tax=Pontibacter mangrovi TaxID=2589816 RepID=A0A501W108_9BACT|nr:serine hydrolase domain-containing protein [Pontibacter mangrovi]TPE42402.1 beta-lactamase family protein [Pontibacter mangrovi]